MLKVYLSQSDHIESQTICRIMHPLQVDVSSYEGDRL